MADNRTLLVVDDEEVVCQACRRIFSRQGFQVEVNTDARQGLSWATEKDYSIILLDIKMPNIDGIEFLEKLREKKPDVPVLIITGYPSIPNASAAMRLGACDYVTKPFTVRGDHLGRATGAEHEPDGDRPVRGFASGWRSLVRRRWRYAIVLGRILGADGGRRIGVRRAPCSRDSAGLRSPRSDCRGSARWSTRVCRWPA